LVQKTRLRIKITPNAQGGGKVVLQYSSVAELDMIIETLDKKRKAEPNYGANSVFKSEEAPADNGKFSIKIVD
jgi:hypothetical protein